MEDDTYLRIVILLLLPCLNPHCEGQTLLETEESEFSDCYGSYLEINCTSDPGSYALITSIQYGFKLTSVGCPDDGSGDKALCCTPHSADCFQDYVGNTSYYPDCMGYPTCGNPSTSARIVHFNTGISCVNNGFMSPFLYLVARYYCISSDRRWEMCSTTSISKTVVDKPVHLLSKSYPQPMTATDTSSGCSCAVETDDCTAVIHMFVFHLDLAGNETCHQDLRITDGNETRTLNCTSNTGYTATVVTSNTNYLRLEAPAGQGGNFWFGFQASETGASLHIDCPAPAERQYCVPQGVGLGEACDSDLTYCQINNSYCDSTSTVCVCGLDFFQDNGTCREKVELGEICSVEEACRPANSECVSTDNTCSCINTHYNNSGECDTLVDLGGTCRVSLACGPHNSSCVDGVCTCDVVFYQDGNACMAKVGLNETCSNSVACLPVNSSCIANQCQCDADLFEKDLECRSKVELGEICSVDEACRPANSECVSTDNTCSCINTHYNNSGECDTLVDLGGACLVSLACGPQNSSCVDGVCTCDIVFYQDGNSCMAKVGLNKTCTNSLGCLPVNSSCVSNQCQCSPDHFFEKDAECKLKASLGGGCTQVSECLPSNVDCASNICVCAENYYNNEGQCSAKVNLGSPCSLNGACVADNAVCEENVCTCATTFYQNNSDCIPKAGFGEVCSVGIHCVSNICTAGVCSCSENQYVDNDNCISKSPVGGQCQQSLHCLQDSTVCEANMCACVENYYQNVDQCDPVKAIGVDCTTDASCASGHCENVCACHSFQYTDDDTCRDKSEVGQSCSSREQCLDGNSYCLRGLCACLPSYSLQSNGCTIQDDENEVLIIALGVVGATGAILLVLIGLLLYRFVIRERCRNDKSDPEKTDIKNTKDASESPIFARTDKANGTLYHIKETSESKPDSFKLMSAPIAETISSKPRIDKPYGSSSESQSKVSHQRTEGETVKSNEAPPEVQKQKELNLKTSKSPDSLAKDRNAPTKSTELVSPTAHPRLSEGADNQTVKDSLPLTAQNKIKLDVKTTAKRQDSLPKESNAEKKPQTSAQDRNGSIHKVAVTKDESKENLKAPKSTSEGKKDSSQLIVALKANGVGDDLGTMQTSPGLGNKKGKSDRVTAKLTGKNIGKGKQKSDPNNKKSVKQSSSRILTRKHSAKKNKKKRNPSIIRLKDLSGLKIKTEDDIIDEINAAQGEVNGEQKTEMFTKNLASTDSDQLQGRAEEKWNTTDRPRTAPVHYLLDQGPVLEQTVGSRQVQEEMRHSENPIAIHLISYKYNKVGHSDDEMSLRASNKLKRRKPKVSKSIKRTRAIKDPFLRMLLGETEVVETKRRKKSHKHGKSGRFSV